MRIAIMLGCAAALSICALAADQPRYRMEMRFVKSDANAQSFGADRDQCLRATNSYHRFVTQDILPGANTIPRPSTYIETHGPAFYRCMTAKGYRSDANGPFQVSLSTEL